MVWAAMHYSGSPPGPPMLCKTVGWTTLFLSTIALDAILKKRPLHGFSRRRLSHWLNHS